MPGVPGQAGGRALYAKYGREYFVELGRKGAAARKENLRKNIISAMTEIIEKIVKEAKSNASWSTTIPKAISFGGIKEENNTFHGQIIINIDKDSEDGAPEARAFEYGSGIHATKGPVGLYPIPKVVTDKNLVFFWEKKGDWFVGPKLPYGHPGVAPKPYIRPAIEANMDEMKARLKSAFKRAYVEVGVTRIEV